MMIAPESILKQTFGFDSFKALQKEVIQHVLDKRDTLAVMPTGGGKSLCYQIPALTFQGLTVVVSPLIALMKDQVEQMRALGIPALFLNSSLSPAEYRAGMRSVRAGETRLLLVAPETLLLPHILELLSERQVECLTIDEAHCISEWGHDFRPEYRQLAAVRKRFPKAVCLALTATATRRVRADITSNLGFTESNTFVASFNRPNLYIEVIPKQDPANQIEQFLKRFERQSGIIYCFSRKQVNELAEWLTRRGHSARPYHAGLADDERRRNQEAFIRDDVQIMVATIAFGMGINKPNVRFVIHHDLPKSIEGYYQEIGRAGRDGLAAHCLLLYSYADVAKLRYFIDQKQGDERNVAQQHMNAMVRYAEDDRQCRRKPLLSYFGENCTSAYCGNCDNCSNTPTGLQETVLPARNFLSRVFHPGGRAAIGDMGVRRPPEERSRRKAREVVVEGDEALFELLRTKRKQMADAAGIPPYVVFSDRTLVEMATRFPQSEQSLGRISGVGQAKLRSYGAGFLEIIRAYCGSRGIAEDFDETTKPPVQTHQKRASMRARLVGDAYNAGSRIQDLMSQYDVQLSTILNHLENYRAAGQVLRPAVELESEIRLSPDVHRQILDAFAERGDAVLKPVFDKFNGTVSYEDLKIVRFVRSSRNQVPQENLQ
jgi:ATP-dependent DNA helicase RecQ